MTLIRVGPERKITLKEIKERKVRFRRDFDSDKKYCITQIENYLAESGLADQIKKLLAENWPD